MTSLFLLGFMLASAPTPVALTAQQLRGEWLLTTMHLGRQVKHLPKGTRVTYAFEDMRWVTVTLTYEKTTQRRRGSWQFSPSQSLLEIRIPKFPPDRLKVSLVGNRLILSEQQGARRLTLTRIR